MFVRKLMCDQYPSKKKSITLLLRHGLERVDKSILKSWENPFQLSMHFRVIEFNPYFVVDKYGVNIQPNSEFEVLISCTSLIFLKYESKQAGRFFFPWSYTNSTFCRVIRFSSLRIFKRLYMGSGSAWKSEKVIVRIALFWSLKTFSVCVSMLWPQVWQPYIIWEENIAW